MDRPGISLWEKLGSYSASHSESEQIHKMSALITTENTDLTRNQPSKSLYLT